MVIAKPSVDNSVNDNNISLTFFSWRSYDHILIKLVSMNKALVT